MCCTTSSRSPSPAPKATRASSTRASPISNRARSISPRRRPPAPQVMLNLANPAAAFRWWRLPADGVGLARMEFVVTNHIKVHPMALVHFDTLKDDAAKAQIAELTAGYADKQDYFVDRLARGLGRIAAAFYPKPVIVRMSDFKTNEYADLIGGAEFEPKEENPMLGFRGASRYYSPRYREGFALECRAIHRLRETMGFTNVIVMIPFCRSTKEADRVLAVMAENGLKRGRERAAGLCDVRDPVECHPREGIRRALRRLLDRQQRPHPADARRRPRFVRARRPVRRAGRGGEMDDPQRDRGRARRRRQGRACAARRRATIRNSPSSWSIAVSIPCRSARTASSPSSRRWPRARPQCRAPASGKRRRRRPHECTGDRIDCRYRRDQYPARFAGTRLDYPEPRLRERRFRVVERRHRGLFGGGGTAGAPDAGGAGRCRAGDRRHGDADQPSLDLLGRADAPAFRLHDAARHQRLRRQCAGGAASQRGRPHTGRRRRAG